MVANTHAAYLALKEVLVRDVCVPRVDKVALDKPYHLVKPLLDQGRLDQGLVWYADTFATSPLHHLVPMVHQRERLERPPERNPCVFPCEHHKREL